MTPEEKDELYGVIKDAANFTEDMMEHGVVTAEERTWRKKLLRDLRYQMGFLLTDE